MTYIAKKKVKGKDYYFIVKGVRDGDKVKQKILYNIGDRSKLDKLYESIKKQIHEKIDKD